MASTQNSDLSTDDKNQENIKDYEQDDSGQNDRAEIEQSGTKKDLRRVETTRQRATAAATVLMVLLKAAVFFVPEGVKNHIRLPRRIIIGIITAILLLGTFFTLFWWYGDCDRYKILTHDTDGMEPGDCTIEPNSIFTTLRLDTDSKWELEPTFSKSTAYWQVKFLGFGSRNSSNFQQCLNELRQQVNLFLENTANLQTFEMLQYFLHFRFVVKGDLGFAQLMPSFSLDSYVSNFHLSQVKFFQANELQNCEQKACDFSARVSDIKNCASDVSGPFLSYNINRVGSSNGYYTTKRSGTQFWVRLNMKKQQTDQSIVQLFDGDTCNENIQKPIATREIPYFRECETCSLMDINFDIALIIALDFCNKNIKICSSFYNFEAIPYSSSRVYTRIKQILQSKLRTSKATFYDDNIGKFAYTKFELGNEYSIVPEIVSSCDASKVEEDICAKEFHIVFHYYFIRRLGNSGSARLRRRKTRKLLQGVNTGTNTSAPPAQPKSAQKSPAPQVPLPDEVLHNLGFIGTKSYYYSLQNLSWLAASQRCQSLGGNLLQLDSEATENGVNLLLNTNPLYQYTKSSYLLTSPAYFWLGLQNVVTFDGRRELQWTTGLKSSYYNLDPPETNQISCVATVFQFFGQVPSSFWSSLSCELQNAFICEFTVDLKAQLGSLPIDPPVPSPPPPHPSPQVQLGAGVQLPPPPPPPPTQKILQQIASSNIDVQQELQQMQEQEDLQDTVVAMDLQPEPQNQKIIEINASGYNFQTGQSISYDQYGYQFSVLISLSSEEPQLAFNKFQTFMPKLQDKGSNIKFSSSNESSNVPFTLTSNVYECEIEQCRSTLERLATSFANTELFYVMIALLMILIVLACCMDRRSRDEHSASVVEQFQDVFSRMLEAVDL